MADKKAALRNRKWLFHLVHIVGLLPLILLGWAALQGGLGFNPVESVLHRMGHAAVIFLLLSLASSPINKIFKLPWVGRLRKPLGLYAALYAFLHFATFAIWDYGLNFSLIWMEILQKPFIFVGLAALIILAVLAATSFRLLQRKMGKYWIWLHRLAYLAGVLMMVHYLLAVKGDLFSLQGDYSAPLNGTGVLILLFVLRLPAVYLPLRRLINRE